MAREDVRIDYDTNDLIFKKAAKNVISDTEFVYDPIEGIATLRVQLTEELEADFGWKTHDVYVDGLIDTSAALDSDLMNIEYFFIDGYGTTKKIARFLLTNFLDDATPSAITVSEFRELNSELSANKRSLKIRYYSSNISSVLEIGVSAQSNFKLINVTQPSNKTLRVNWGDTESDVFTGTVSNFTHTFADGAVPHTITIEECDFTAVTAITLGASEVDNGILSIILPRELISCTYLHVGFTEVLTTLSLPNTMVKLVELWLIESAITSLQIPSSLNNLSQIYASNASLTSFNSSALWSNMQIFDFSGCSLGVEDVNQMLVVMDSMTTSQALEVIVDGISNATPDNISGGNDGITAYWSLFDKGYTVQINGEVPRPIDFPTPKVISDSDGVINQSFIPQTSTTSVETLIETFVAESILLGDFFVEDSIPQNEYTLLNINEGAFLQNPTYGTGMSKYIQSPNSDNDIINIIVEKFAQDSLRVMGIEKNNEIINVESEDFNSK